MLAELKYFLKIEGRIKEIGLPVSYSATILQGILFIEMTLNLESLTSIFLSDASVTNATVSVYADCVGDVVEEKSACSIADTAEVGTIEAATRG